MTVSPNDAHPFPIYNARFRVIFPILDADGDLVTGATSPDSEISQDSGTFADCTNEATEIATASGMYYLDLIATELDNVSATLIIKSGNGKTTPITLHPTRLPVIRTGTAQAGAATTITLDASASSADDYYNGCYVNITNNSPANALGQARIITDYVGSTKVATVAAAWGTNPSSASTFEILQTPGVAVDVIAWAGAPVDPPTTVGVPDVTVIAIAADAITASAIATDAIGAAELAAGAITADVFAAGAIDAAAIAANAIGSSELADGAITAAKFAAGAIDATAIATDAIGSAELADGAITAATFAAGAIDATAIATDAIGAAEIADGAITALTFAAGAIDAASIATDAITAAKIAADAIGDSELAADAVTAIQAGLSTVTTAQVNAEVLDVLNVDTFAEIGQETPAATQTMRKMLAYLYKAWRNRHTQTATTFSIYNDDATTVAQKATVSDDGSTFDRTEITTGP